MPALPAVVRSALLEGGLLGDAETVIAALSGGADSVCLADILLGLAPELGFRLECAHFDHRLRGAESRRDAEFVAAWCQARGIPLHLGGEDVGAYAAEHGLGIEEAARKLRYAFLESLGNGKTRIATAHQAEDNAETVLLNLIRGTGLRGLGGIPPQRGRVIRPLLGASREEILAYLEGRGLAWMEDSTNADRSLRRNRLRHEVLPAFREMNPAFLTSLQRTVRLLREDEAELEQRAAAELHPEGDAFAFFLDRLQALGRPVAGRALRLAAGRFGVSLEEKHVEALFSLAASENPSAVLDLPGGLLARRQYAALLIGPPGPEAPAFPETELVFDGWTVIPGKTDSVFWGNVNELTKIHGKFTVFFFKKARICGKMLVRPRKPGDRLQLSGRPGKSLKKWMTEEKIPADERNRTPVFADEAGVIAVPGLGADVRAAVPESEADAMLLIAERT